MSEVHPPPPVGNKPAAADSEVESPPASGYITPAAPETRVPASKRTVRGTDSRGARSQVANQARTAAALAAAWKTIADDDEVYVVPMHQKKAAESGDCAAEETSGDNENAEDL